jgi:hypothetical protein
MLPKNGFLIDRGSKKQEACGTKNMLDELVELLMKQRRTNNTKTYPSSYSSITHMPFSSKTVFKLVVSPFQLVGKRNWNGRVSGGRWDGFSWEPSVFLCATQDQCKIHEGSEGTLFKFSSA